MQFFFNSFLKIIILKKIVIFFILFFSTYISANIPNLNNINSESYILIEFETGDIIVGEKIHERLSPASLTKIMTAYVVFRELKKGNLRLQEEATISNKSWRTKGSRTFLEVGTKVKIEDLIKGLIIQSGNDAAVALAEHISGTEEQFVKLMNFYAKELNMNNTNFNNASGLPTTNHYSSAYDLAILTKSLIKEFPNYYEIYSFEQFTYNNITQRSRNRLLSSTNDFDGVKTGFTNNAGYCFVGSARRGDRRLISVVLNSKTPAGRFEDTTKLMNHGFMFFDLHRVFDKEEYIPQLNTKVFKGNLNETRVGVDEEVVLSLRKNQFNNIKFNVDIYEKIIAPLPKNSVIGTIRLINEENEILVERNLITLDEIEKGSFFKIIKDYLNLKFNLEK